jgi:hypothetical protein
MHFIRDDVSVCSARTTSSSNPPFSRRFSLSRRDIHFRDDLSEYSNASTWSDGTCSLNVTDYRFVSEGLQARPTVAEAILRAEWEKRLDIDKIGCATRMPCLSDRAAKAFLHLLRRTPLRDGWKQHGFSKRPAVAFTWAEVQSIIFLQNDGQQEVPPIYRIVVTTFKMPEEREFLLQAGTPRARARFGVEMVKAILRVRMRDLGKDADPTHCCGSATTPGVTLAFFMDAARITCEAARVQPSPEGMECLARCLDMLAESQCLEEDSQGGSETRAPAPHIPIVALRRFRDSVRQARAAFAEWQRWRLLVRLLQRPMWCDDPIWTGHILPMARPSSVACEDADADGYPASVGQILATAAERCRRTLS